MGRQDIPRGVPMESAPVGWGREGSRAGRRAGTVATAALGWAGPAELGGTSPSWRGVWAAPQSGHRGPCLWLPSEAARLDPFPSATSAQSPTPPGASEVRNQVKRRSRGVRCPQGPRETLTPGRPGQWQPGGAVNSCPSPRGHRGPCALTADKAEPPPRVPRRLSVSVPLCLCPSLCRT